jgi:multidrug efflux pump subunit AcrA (membrane-fusion protein)
VSSSASSSSAGGAAAGRELFRVEQTNTLRAFVNVPQGYVTTVRPGLEADCSSATSPAGRSRGKVERTAGALDPATRTLRVEVYFPNPDGQLFPACTGRCGSG